MRILLLSVFVVLLLGIVLVPAAFEQASAETVGLKEGQWVKYKVECWGSAYTSNSGLEKKLENMLDDECSTFTKGCCGVAGANNIEWVKVKVSKIDGTQVTFDTSIKVKGSAEKSMGSSISNIGRNAGLPEWAIPVGLGVGDQIATPENHSPLRVHEIKNISEDNLWKNKGFENVEFLFLTSTNMVMQDDKEVYFDADFWFERSTGILLANEIGREIINDREDYTTKFSTGFELLDFSTGGIKVQEKTDLGSLSFKEAERKIANLEGTGKYIINKVCCDNMGDDNIVNKYEILTANHEEIGMLQIEGKDKVDVIWANSYSDYSRDGATFSDASKIMSEIQLKFVPELGFGERLYVHLEDGATETKKVGSKTIKLETKESTVFGTSIVEFILMIDYGTVGFVPTQPPIETSKTPTQEEVTVGVPEQIASTDTDIVYILGLAVAIGVTIIVCILIIRLKKKTKTTQQKPSSVLQQPAEEEQTLSYDLPSRKRSDLWYISCIFGIIGGVIAYFILRKDDPKKAKNCLYFGIGTTVIGIFLQLLNI